MFKNYEQRTDSFKRNEMLEILLADLNSNLQLSEAALTNEFSDKSMNSSLILVMGPPRSGSTLFTQWLGNTGLVTYPTNLLSRFYRAPIIGAKIQLLLTDPRYNYRDEFREFIHQSEYLSENGKTRGVLAPNEFWYFWRRFIAESSRDVWLDDELRRTMDVKTMKAELIGMMDVFQKPFLAKGMLFNYNIPFFDEIFDKVIFVQMQRDICTNVASVLEARKRQLGNIDEWYSFRIPEYLQLKNLDPVSQSVGQVHYINEAVTKGITTVDESRKLVVQYEDFCDNPRRVYEALLDKLGFDCVDSELRYSGPERFRVSRMDDNNMNYIRKSIKEFRG